MKRRRNAITYLHKRKPFAFWVNSVTRYREKGDKFGGDGMWGMLCFANRFFCVLCAFLVSEVNAKETSGLIETV